MKAYQPAIREKRNNLQDINNESGMVQSKGYPVRTAYSVNPFQFQPDLSLANNGEVLLQPKSAPVQRKEHSAITGYPQPPAPPKPGKTGLPAQLKKGTEALSGFSMNDVKVHYNSDRPAQLHAFAFAKGTDIHVGPGQEKHLPHEAWHVVQQKQGRVRATTQMKGAVPVNDDRALEHEADIMGQKAIGVSQSEGQHTTLKQTTADTSASAPIQGRFGFEVELPILFLDKEDRDVVSLAGGGDIAMVDVPRDAAFRNGETELYDGPECHVNVDHSKTLNQLFDAELNQYSKDNALTPDEKNSLLAERNDLIPHGASILEVVTDAWDESTLSRAQAMHKIRTVIAWIRARYNSIAGDQQASLGNYYIGSDSPQSDRFQPRIGYFHATYGVKLSQVPRLLKETTVQKNRLKNYVKTNAPQKEHSDSLRQTYNSIAAAKTALKDIKAAWPRTGGGTFKKGTKGWNNGSEKIFLGFINLLTNYLLMFKANNGANLAKQMVGMHYYKSDLYDVARQLPHEIITTLSGNAALLTDTIKAIGDATGVGVNSTLGIPMGNVTLTEYLEQIFTGHLGVIRNLNGDDLYDEFLSGSINPYSKKLGPDLLGPTGNKEQGMVMENRHLEYLDPNYGRNLDASEAQLQQDYADYVAPTGVDTRTADQKAMFDSIGAREEGPAKRPIGEWEGIMIGIYDMISRINRR